MADDKIKIESLKRVIVIDASDDSDSALKKLIVVPEIDLTGLCAITDFDESSFYELHNAWSRDGLVHVADWLQAREEHRTPSSATAQKLFQHALGAHYTPLGLSDSGSRSLIEMIVLEVLGKDALPGALEQGRFIDLLIRISALSGGSRELRAQSVGTKPDGQGIAIRYPDHAGVEERLLQLSDLLKTDPPPLRAAIFAMNAVFNIHPFMDGNGRVGRIVFHLVLRHLLPNAPFLPIGEFSRLSGGGFVLALREAQYFGRWNSLAEYILRFSKLTSQIINSARTGV